MFDRRRATALACRSRRHPWAWARRFTNRPLCPLQSPPLALEQEGPHHKQLSQHRTPVWLWPTRFWGFLWGQIRSGCQESLELVMREENPWQKHRWKMNGRNTQYVKLFHFFVMFMRFMHKAELYNTIPDMQEHFGISSSCEQNMSSVSKQTWSYWNTLNKRHLALNAICTDFFFYFPSKKCKILMIATSIKTPDCWTSPRSWRECASGWKVVSATVWIIFQTCAFRANSLFLARGSGFLPFIPAWTQSVKVT